ncbi:hypothetical protein [Nostoc punctiforme]|uniref:Uncharacterized protein n=1 Tax=Nostoc punctiforme (strain ATCC 29133 / PCC 73102) TaxID=63737 RepID=B2J1I5_NOSP7|nr:hypothetical protein [Nostoc punctiforme]ACC80346.1 hypothetical protein Npun_F1674 [Nostoc punctiforme PCC 73102]
MVRRRGNKVQAYVIFKGSLKYGFQINEGFHETYKSELGQTTFAGAVGVFFGCNSPKPNRASKLIATGNISSFCSSASEKNLQKAGWTITSKGSNIRGIKTAGLTRTVYVPMPGGYNYAWNITAAEISHAEELGILEAAGDTANLIWGSTPKPPRASKKDASGTVSTFIQPKQSIITGAVEKGWSIRGINYALLPE